jgi:thiol-disulfide isomerase/thioredoxin
MKMRKKERFTNLLRAAAVTFCIFAPHLAHTVGAKQISPGMLMPDIRLSAPDSEDTKHYLGLNEFKPFSLSKVRAKLILVEVFSVFCSHCHKNAPSLNKVYDVIQGDSELRDDIKVIAIGAGNNSKQLDVFKTKHRVQFPQFPDPEMYLTRALRVTGTPIIILATNSGEVLMTHTGLIDDLDEVLVQIRQIHNEL